uniref:RING-type domain-containing protein n=1 Tax=Amphimedon queenslandica TaxID=400682 RepID=A0A1X7UCD1_AMPQE
MEDVKSIDWPNETEILHEYYYHINDTFDIKESLEATFELIEFYLYALAMQQAFKMYKLEQCLIDMDNIVKKVNYVKYALESTVTTLNAKQVVKDVKGFFGIKDIIGNSYLQLFVSKHIEQLRKLYEFACERGYQSDDGYQTFRLECQLVTVELLHENHDEQLLSAFQNTMSLVFPFLRHESSLLAFWNDIISIGNISEAISQLSFVNQGMNLIRMWFNIFEEEAPQNKEKLLRSIQSSGVYNYKFSKETGVQLTLTFMKIEERGLFDSYLKGMFKQLTKVSLQQYGMLYYYNISLFLPEESDENHKLKFNQLVDDVNWFFFDYFVLGYVEISVDTKQQSHCRSLCLPSGMSTDVYIEVPYWNVNCDVTKSFNKFCELFPALTLLGEQMIPKMEFDIEHYQGTQLVCKYLKASQNNNLDHLYTDFPGQRSSPIKIGNIYQDLSAEECRSILQHNFKHSIAQSKLLQAVYLKYMERRCKLLEDCFQLCFLQDVKDGSLIKDDKGEGLTGFSPKNMRSTLFNLMKEEVEDFCKSSVIQATDEHQQVIYDVDKNGGIVFKFFCTGIPSQEKRRQLRAIGVKLEPMSDHYFHDCLSAALNVKTDDSNCITLIKEKKYVLTKDFVRKMLTIHERRECGMPVILEGETGVGKTFLLQMLSSLWNDSWKQQFLSLKNDMQNFLYELMTKVEKSVTIGARASNLILTVKTDLKASKRKISFKTLHDVLKLAVSSITYTKIKIELLKIVYDPLVGNIELPTDSHTDKPLFDFLRSIQDEKETDDTISMAHVINGILYGELKSIFYKLSLHSDMKPKKIEEFLVSVNQHALMLLECYKKHHSTVLQYQKPIITVFFDEINTSSCPGYLKEVIIDKAVNGRALAENIFIVAACNPHRGNSLAMLAKQNDSWFNASYYVQSLPHTLSILKWEYGQLEAKDENEYIHKMLLLTYEDRSKNVCKIVAEIIARAQELMRAYAFKHLKSILNTESYLEEKKAELYAKSTVSQRDIKRVFQLHVWLETWFKKDTKYGKIENDIQIMTRAFYVAVALVYYFRLNICDREDFKEQMMCYSSLFDTCGQNFVQSLNDELNWVDRVIDFSAGIAPTFALKENIYAIIICTMAHVPIFIVGPPGSSKTLSFKIAIHNCQGQESKNNELKDCNTFKCLDPHPYQCSKKSTSSEIETVFKRAINRQQTIDNTRRLAVVMMDEAGLPEDSHESLKVLHHFLDDEPLVSFVGISNDILDAAKTNRTVTMYRSEISSQDLVQLAKYSLTAGNLPISWNRDEETMITNIVEVYENLMNDSRRPHIRQFFGLRDFIHFFAYLGHSKNHQDDVIKPQAVMEALGHNFNGTKDFSSIVQVFFKAINFNPENVKKQSLIQLLQSSFRNTDRDLSSENQVRYKLLIDSSEDQSLVRLLFRFDIFRRDATKILSCSRFPFDDNSQKLYTTAAIRHAARVGHTTLIYQAEEIQENFYDLFNQRFLCINTPGTNEKVLFANVAIGTIIKPTRVSPFFNCAVIINNSDKSKTSKPFLNRFEKYSLSHEVLFQESLSSCQYHIKNILVYAKNNVEDFVKNCGKSCFYGFTEQTIDSLMLLVLPTQHVTDSANASSIGADFEPSSKVDFLALCLLRQFHLVYGTCIDVGHYELFSEAVLFAINSISKNDKDIVQKFLDDPIDFESINEVARMTVKGNKVSSQLSLKLLQELIVIFLHYQLIRIMSPEGLVTCCGTDETIPDFYKKCYIRYQHHFSLHNFIQEQYQLLDKRKEFVAKKFLCFTHTSQSIMEMIPNYTSCHSKYTQEKEKMQEFFCFDEERKFHTYIMSHATSQEKIQDILRMFLECDNSNTPTEVLLLFANMNELAKDTINHARILIEESECFYQQLHCNKLIFFILHFPPQMFYNCCYPTLFLDGWQHVYLDKIGEMKGVQYINIEKWLDICLLEKSTASSECKMHDIFVHDFVWTDLLSETIVLSSGSITMKQLKDFPPKDAQFQEICLYWTALLKIDEISSVLSKRFYSFWQQEAMHELTFKIARFAVTYRSSCTLSQAVEETIKSSYKELVLYFICIMNQQFVMHTLHQYDENIVPNTKLICEILSILPIPDSLQQLQLEVAILTKQSHIDTVKDFSSPKIPFFNLIFDAMENIINQVFKQYLQSVDINDEEEYLENSETTWAHDINSASTDNDKDHIIKKTEELIEQSKDDCLIIKFAIGAMKVNEEFWDYYLEDSLSRKLSRDVCIFTKQFFNLASIQSDDFTRRFISLHYHLRLYRLDSHYLSLLRLLDECVCYIDTYHVESQLLSNLNKNSVLTTGIDVLYTSLGSLHKSGKCAKFYELSDLFYQVISNFKSHDDLDLDSVTKKKLIVLSIIYFVNNLKRRDEIILQPFDNFVLKLMEAANIISEKYIKAVSLAQLVQEYFDDVRHSHFVICEHIVEYYVNQHIHDMTDEDIKWIWEVMNRIELEHDLSSSWLQSKFKYHLKKLLENPQEAHIYGTRELTGVLLFNDRVRSILGSVIDSKDPSSCFNYYPYDYRNCASLRFKLQKSINVPLCDTYYEIVLEKLQSYDSSISDVVLFSNMLSFYERLAESIKSETCQSKKKLLVIEKQAVIQIVIEKLAHIVVQHDGSTDENMIGIIETVLDESNAVSKYSTAAISDNSLILLMRVLQVCRNERKLKVELVDNIDNISLLTSFKCVRQITAVLKFNQIPNEGFLPFLSQCYSSQMTLFNSVHEAMKSIIKYPGKKQKIEPIHRIAVKCNASKQEKFTFIMSVFLSAHIEFFVNKKNSHRILPILSEELFQYIGKEYWCFIDWMANPMPDSPMSLSNQELHNFFVQPNEDNQMHIQCLIELAAVVLGSSSDSHFWTHLFEPNNIKTDFLPGSIITGCVDAKYLKVMSLKDTPISYTHRMSLNWFSLLVLQWMNYGLLCIAMVVNSTRHHQDLVHPIWSNEQLPSPQEAMLHLNVLWEKIAIDCNITIDERDCLMFSCIQNLYKAFMKHELQSHWSILNSNNTCTTQDEFLKALRQYEITVHTNVFVPAWNSLKKREHFNRFGDPIVNNLRDLRNNVKQLQIYGGTQLDDFLTILLSSTMLHDKKCELFTLYQFILTRPALNVGAIVLPKLVDLYCWIHNNLQFKVTFEIARSQSVRTVLESLLDQFFPGKKVKEMTKIEVMIEQYGNLRHFFKCLPEISTDMKFYHLLHMINGSKDVLFKAITEIVERYNSFLDDHQLNISTKGRFIHVTEVTEESCLFANLRSIDKLLSYRNLQDLKTIILKYCSMRNIGKSDPESDNSIIPDCVPEVFHFKAIQNEIFSLFISHKQKISLENFWKKFDFYKSMQNISPQSLFHSSVHYKEVIEIIEAQYPHLAKDKADEISTINENIDPNDEALLPSVIELENTFHSLNHDSLVELCSGLFLILQKILEKIPKVDDTHIYSLRSLTICEFLSESCSDMNDALNHVGIVKHSADRTRSSLSESQYKFISDTRLNAVVYLTKFFQDWLEIGYYDFHHLPFCMKSHLVEDIQHDITEWMQNQETLKIVTDLAYFMFKFEKDLVEKACCNNDTAIGEVINEELDIIPVWLPKVSVKYYVHIHLELRKKLFEREEQPESQSNLSEGPPEEVNPQKESTPPPIVKSSSVVSIPSLPQTIIPVPFINEIDTKESELRKLAEMKTAKDVAEFMNAEGFHETAGIFSEDEDMDGLVVYELLSDDEILRKDFALHTALLRLKFRILFKRWLTNSVSLLGQVSPDKVAQLFWRHNRLKEFCEVIKKEQIDGEMLEMAKTPELEDLGIIGIPCTIVPKVVKEIKEQLSVMCPVCNCKIETASASVKLFSCLHCVHNVCFEKLMLKNCPECRNPIH